MKKFIPVILSLIFGAFGALAEKNPRALSLFTIVQFPNNECQSTTTAMAGTCFSSTECSAQGGSALGKCAAGFGICCTFSIDTTTGGTVTKNRTYIQNFGYPVGITTASASIVYKVNPVSTDICQLRFDFVALKLPIDATTGVCGGTNAGSFLVASPITPVSGPSAPPAICGDNAGYHMYTDVGMSATSTTVTIGTGTSTTDQRIWKIKISQIECSNLNKAPLDCTQWFTASAGQIDSYNFKGGLMIAQVKTVYCFKQNTGTCGVTYTVDPGTTTPHPFGIAAANVAPVPTNTLAVTFPLTTTIFIARNSDCDVGKLEIPAVASVSTGTYCGSALALLQQAGSETVVASANGAIDSDAFVATLTGIAASVASSPGFRLNYVMRAC